ncbi:MAG: class I tRNA ligase family protein [Duncaniella sp.]|nr:class I tRNA ligase family protein [Duncaniella sp.]
MSNRFPEYSGLNLAEVNREILAQWAQRSVFDSTITERKGAPSFVFFEGPPSANGRPGIHHVQSLIHNSHPTSPH